MDKTLLLDPVRILRGIGQSVEQGAVLVEEGILTAFDGDARQKAKALGLTPTEASEQLVAPCLVDPHSVLETPFNGDQETIDSLRRCAASAGYGQVALLPRGRTWRDQPECLQGFSKDPKMAFNFTFREDSAKAEHPNGWRPMVTCSNTALSD